MFSSSEMSKLGTSSEDGGFRAGMNWQRRGSTGEPRLWLSLPFPESKSAEVMKRLSTSWPEDNCGHGSKLGDEASRKAPKSRLKAPACPCFLLGCCYQLCPGAEPPTCAATADVLEWMFSDVILSVETLTL